MAASTSGDKAADDSLYPIAVLIDELKNEDIQVSEEASFRERSRQVKVLLIDRPHEIRKLRFIFNA